MYKDERQARQAQIENRWDREDIALMQLNYQLRHHYCQGGRCGPDVGCDLAEALLERIAHIKLNVRHQL